MYHRPEPKFRKGEIVFSKDDMMSGTILSFKLRSYYVMDRPIKIIEEFRYEILMDSEVKYFLEPDLKRIKE